MRLTEEQNKILRYIRQYPDWLNSAVTMSTVRAITYDTDKVQTSPEDMMMNIALQIEDYEERIEKVDRCLAHVYVTDTMIVKARKRYCYGIRNAMSNYDYYSHRRLLADCLIEVFGNEKR